MSGQSQYTSLPGGWRSDTPRTAVIIINGVTIPAIPAGSCLLFLTGLVMWAVGMLTARTTVDGIFSDLGLTAESLDQLKASVLAGVLLLSVLAIIVGAANVWLEYRRLQLTGSRSTGALPAVHAYSTHAFRLNVANWVLLLLVAMAMAGSITWLTTMSTALSATQQTGGYGDNTMSAQLSTPSHRQTSDGLVVATADHDSESTESRALPGPAKDVESIPGYQAGFDPTKPHAPPDVKKQASRSKSVGKEADLPDVSQLWSTTSYGSRCPPGCVDLGLIAQVLGLPWPCFCQVWLLGDLEEQLKKVVAQLWVAVVGVLLLFSATSWLYGYLAAQAAHAARDMQELTTSPQSAILGSSI